LNRRNRKHRACHDHREQPTESAIHAIHAD
jgi:hypothetical protein